MRSVQLIAPKALELRSLAEPPDPGPGEVVVKVLNVGICGSDLHWYADGHIGRSRAKYPQILGHEPLCQVVRSHAGVTNLVEGSRVTIEPNLSCTQCEPCVLGQENLCVTNTFMGGPNAYGFFRDYVTVPARNVVPLPAKLSGKSASLIEPLSIIVHAVEIAPVRAGDVVAITGAGPIGMLCAAVARASGAGQVFVCDPVHHRLELAMSMGATMACDPDAFEELIRDETRGRGADLALEASGSPVAVNRALTVTRAGGTVMLIGLTSDLVIPFDIHQAMGKQLAIKTVRRSNHRAQRAIRMLESGLVPDTLITHVLPLDRTPEAFEMLSDYRDGAGKIVIEVNA